MTLLVPLRRYAPFEVRPIELILTSTWRARGYNFTRELMQKDRWRGNRTAFRAWRDRLPRCVECTHGSRMWPVTDKDAYECRWGHMIDGLELEKRRRRAAA